MKITKIGSIWRGMKEKKPRAAISIRHIGCTKAVFTVTEFPSGEQTTLPEAQAWDMYKKINRGNLVNVEV